MDTISYSSTAEDSNESDSGSVGTIVIIVCIILILPGLSVAILFVLNKLKCNIKEIYNRLIRRRQQKSVQLQQTNLTSPASTAIIKGTGRDKEDLNKTASQTKVLCQDNWSELEENIGNILDMDDIDLNRCMTGTYATVDLKMKKKTETSFSKASLNMEDGETDDDVFAFSAMNNSDDVQSTVDLLMSPPIPIKSEQLLADLNYETVTN